MYARAAGLLRLPAPQALPLAGDAACFDAATGRLLAYDARGARLTALEPRAAAGANGGGDDGGSGNGSGNGNGGGSNHVLRSARVDDIGALPAGAAFGRPLLAALGASGLVALTTGDGAVRLWDAWRLVPAGVLGVHAGGPLTSLSADGELVGSTCGGELRLWRVDAAAAAHAADAAAAALAAAAGAATGEAGATATGAAVAGHEAATSSGQQQQEQQQQQQQPAALSPQQALLEAARAPVGQCLCALPIGFAVNMGALPAVIEPRVAVCASRQLAVLVNATAPVPSPVVKVFSAAPENAGALLRELPANAAFDAAFLPGRLVVASSFQGRPLGGGAGGGAGGGGGGGERAFTVVAHVWDTDSWAWSRLVSPRLAAPLPVNSPAAVPRMHATQDWVLIATPEGGIGQPLRAAMHAWRLPPCTNSAGAAAAADNKVTRLTAADGAAGLQQQHQQQHQHQQGPQPLRADQRPPVFLFAGDGDGVDPWQTVLADAGPWPLLAVTSSPDRLLLLPAPGGEVRASTVCAPPPPPTARRPGFTFEAAAAAGVRL